MIELQDEIITFDTIYTTNHIQILKLILPHLPGSIQKDLSVYIKYKELYYTLFCQKNNNPPFETNDNKQEFSKLFQKIRPYCNENEATHLDKIKDFQEQIINMQEMLQMIQLLQPMMQSDGKDTMDDLLKTMLTPEQQAMFYAFNDDSENKQE